MLEQTMCPETSQASPISGAEPLEVPAGASGTSMDQNLAPFYMDIMEKRRPAADSCRLSANAAGVA